jgi:hypothetical protein
VRASIPPAIERGLWYACYPMLGEKVGYAEERVYHLILRAALTSKLSRQCPYEMKMRCSAARSLKEGCNQATPGTRYLGPLAYCRADASVVYRHFARYSHTWLKHSRMEDWRMVISQWQKIYHPNRSHSDQMYSRVCRWKYRIVHDRSLAGGESRGSLAVLSLYFIVY